MTNAKDREIVPVGRMRILVAEDSLDDLFLLREAFDATGLPGQIEHITDGQTLWQQLQDDAHAGQLPDLLIVDFYLPLISGDEIIGRLRSELPAFHSVPILVLSSGLVARQMLDLEALGVRALVKPLDLDDYLNLADTIKLWLNPPGPPPV